MAERGLLVRCGGGGRWRADPDSGDVVATPGLIGPGISTRPCGWVQVQPGQEPPEACPWCGGQVGVVEVGGRVRPLRVVPLP